MLLLSLLSVELDSNFCEGEYWGFYDIRCWYTYSPNYFYACPQPEKHIKRQATHHDCLPSAQLAGRWVQMKWNNVWRGKKTLYWVALSSQGKTNISCTDTMSPTEPSKEGPLPYVLLESPFASVSAVSRAHPSVVSLLPTPDWKIN